jgi:hypothetical protein
MRWIVNVPCGKWVNDCSKIESWQEENPGAAGESLTDIQFRKNNSNILNPVQIDAAYR